MDTASIAPDIDLDESIDDGSDAVEFTPEILQILDSVLPSEEPLDRPDFDIVAYINQIFPTEQSLANIDNVIGDVRGKIHKLDDEIIAVVRGQALASTANGGVDDGRAALREAEGAIKNLIGKIVDIKTKAEKSEDMVKEITRDIKQLDQAKRNLTLSITALSNLEMLATGVDSLVQLSKERKYAEVSRMLQGVENVVQQFGNYMHIPQIREMADKVKMIQSDLSQQIMADFRDAFQGGGLRHGSGPTQQQLSEACLVVQVLPQRVRHELLTWFIQLQLSEYLVLFADTQEAAWLDKIDKRYTWIKRLLVDFDDTYAKLFPPSWSVTEQICVEFCRTTRNELSKLMQRRSNEIDVKTLLFAIQKTTAFEILIAKRFTGESIENRDPTRSPFSGVISKCFEPHLVIYIEAQDKNLQEMMIKWQLELRSQQPSSASAASTGGVLPPDPLAAAAAECSNVFRSAGDLFLFYKDCLRQCTSLSSGQPMLELTRVFQKYLRDYAQKVLSVALPKPSSSSSTGSSLASVAGKDFSTAAAAAGSLLAGILKDERSSGQSNEAVRLSDGELGRACAVLCTAEYCLDTTGQLQEKLKEKIDKELIEKVNLAQEQSLFNNVIGQAIQILVADLESACDTALLAMSRLNWNTVETVGDQSPFVTTLVGHWRSTVPVVRAGLNDCRQYFTQFCIKFANIFVTKYAMHLYKCRLAGTMGCEQLLLDTHSLKTVLLDLPNLGTSEARKTPSSYSKIVVKGMTRAEMILKLANFPIEPAAIFVDNYVRLLPDGDAVEFQKLLEMKCLKKSDQPPLIELYRQRQKQHSGSVSDAPPRTETAAVVAIDKAPSPSASATTTTTTTTSAATPFTAPTATTTTATDSPRAADGPPSQSLSRLEKLIKKHL